MFRSLKFNLYQARRYAREGVAFFAGTLAAMGALYLTAKPIVSEFENVATLSNISGRPVSGHEQQPLDAKRDAELLAMAGVAIGGGFLLRQKREENEFQGLVGELELDHQARVDGEDLYRETVQYLRTNPTPPDETR